ncbi:MAG TPA: FapA family protein [Spirochaetota bacterium]|nr:FapA family protein [Spirochaetota bacterium]HPI88586.1 FapA family protein [Spirochaetota bacterium]HPR48227.1 FapA family protein [Spirochaetota bacterium]
MSKLKDLFMDISEGEDHPDENAVEVFADSVRQALEMASRELSLDVTMLDYQILEKGTSGLFGMGRKPYRVLISPHSTSPQHADLEEIEMKLSGEHIPSVTIEEKKNADGTCKIRVTKTGIWATVVPPRGNGKALSLDEINNKLYSMRITSHDASRLAKEVTRPSGKPVKIGQWLPNPDFDSSMRVEISEDEMRAFVHFIPPRYSGRHMETDDVLEALKTAGVAHGVNNDRISDYLENMDYHEPLVAAQGQRARNGRDAYIDYKVRIDNTRVSFEEDESGKVDFRNLELLENVVVGQLLAIKVPAEEGVPGRTVTNRILPSRAGKDTKIQYGKGTILSEDGTELTAEINGQVVFKVGRISVEPVYVVTGDVSLETGNIVFLGSVIVQGSVQDNFIVKAAGNIEVKGTVQKAFLESEGDIIVRQGIMGRDEAKIESTGGSIYAKFIQGANVIAEGDIRVPEGIMHSHVDAGKGIYCNGRRARIVGGVIRAGDEVNARYIGADVSTKTEVRVGINPKILQQITDLENLKKGIDEELGQNQLNQKTLETQKKSGVKLSPEREKMLMELTSQNEKLAKRQNEVNLELEELKSYIDMLEHKGKVCAEKTAFPGVDVHIKDKKFILKDPYNSVKFSLEGGEIRISEYELPAIIEGQRITTVVRRR